MSASYATTRHSCTGFIPLVGYAGDAVVVARGPRRVIRAAGVEALERHWTRTPGLAVVKRLAGVRSGREREHTLIG